MISCIRTISSKSTASLASTCTAHSRPDDILTFQPLCIALKISFHSSFSSHAVWKHKKVRSNMHKSRNYFEQFKLFRPDEIKLLFRFFFRFLIPDVTGKRDENELGIEKWRDSVRWHCKVGEKELKSVHMDWSANN